MMSVTWAYWYALCWNALAAKYALYTACLLAPLYAFVLRPVLCAYSDDDEHGGADDTHTVVMRDATRVQQQQQQPCRDDSGRRSRMSGTATTTAATRHSPTRPEQCDKAHATVAASRHEALMLESRVQHALARCYSLRACDACNVTSRALDELYASPAFARWYAAQRGSLLAQVRLRQRYRWWSSLAAVALLLVGVCVLPAYSFDDVPQLDVLSYAARHTSSRDHSRSAGVRADEVRSWTLARLLMQRAADVRARADGGAPHAMMSLLPPSARHMLRPLRAEAEVLLMVTAVCVLLTSSFMPRRSSLAATVALFSFCVVLVESVAVATVQLRLGLGFLVVLCVVTWRVLCLPEA